jgi:hypothetical protein
MRDWLDPSWQPLFLGESSSLSWPLPPCSVPYPKVDVASEKEGQKDREEDLYWGTEVQVNPDKLVFQNLSSAEVSSLNLPLFSVSYSFFLPLVPRTPTLSQLCKEVNTSSRSNRYMSPYFWGDRMTVLTLEEYFGPCTCSLVGCCLSG